MKNVPESARATLERLTALLVLAALSVLGAAGLAHAQIVTTGSVTGSGISSPANVPGPVIVTGPLAVGSTTAPGDLSVTGAMLTAQNALTVPNGNLTINSDGIVTIVIPGSGSGSDAAGGQTNNIIGEGSVGKITVSGSGAMLDISRPANTVPGTFAVLGLGGRLGTTTGGTGTLIVENGGTVSLDSIAVGNGPGGTGTVIIMNGGMLKVNKGVFLIQNPSAFGTVTVDGSSSTLTSTAPTNNVGSGTNGTGILNIENGGAVTIDGGTRTLNIAVANGSTGILNIGAPQGSSSMLPGTLDASFVAFGSGTGTTSITPLPPIYSRRPLGGLAR